jgi:hypothetical protein
MQHVLRAKSPSDRAREAYFQGKMSADDYLRQALGADACQEVEPLRTMVQVIRHSPLQAIR